MSVEIEEDKKFTLDGSRFNQANYWGRFRGFLEVIDPRCLFVSQEEINKSLDLLKQFEDFQKTKAVNSLRLPPGVSDQDLWQAKKIRDAVIHPATGEVIPAPFRISGFLPANVPLVAGMLNFPSPLGTVFWQWANQSYNSAINYANRSGNEVSNDKLLQSYVIAVSVSCSIALGFRFLGQRGPRVINEISKIPFVVPFFSVASAGSANVYFSRLSELQNGVKVVDENNRDVGNSKIAAKQAVMKTILSRSIGLPIPVLILPHFMMKLVPKSVGTTGLMMFELSAITISIAVGLPAAIAMFPQKLEFDVNSLEPEFHNLKDQFGKPVLKLFSNKGL